jgi:3-oxoacyl-[acyl-carrier protein] reductase
VKRVLITGATGAIGAAIAEAFAKAGYYLYLHYNTNENKAQALLKELEAEGETIGFDVSDPQAVSEKLKDMEVDVLVNNAGITRDNLFFWMKDEEWDAVMRTNLDGYYHVIKATLPKMVRKKRGAIINMASVSGISGNPGQCNYSAAKGGVIALTKALSAEVARQGIRVNCVAPGLIDSEMTAKLPKDQLLPTIPMRRFGKPEEVADTVLFLAEKGGYITGEVINISGGMVR